MDLSEPERDERLDPMSQMGQLGQRPDPDSRLPEDNREDKRMQVVQQVFEGRKQVDHQTRDGHRLAENQTWVAVDRTQGQAEVEAEAEAEAEAAEQPLTERRDPLFWVLEQEVKARSRQAKTKGPPLLGQLVAVQLGLEPPEGYQTNRAPESRLERSQNQEKLRQELRRTLAR